MMSPVQFPFLPVTANLPGPLLMPLMPLSLSHNSNTLLVTGLVDSGAAMNVIPRSVGDALGADWDSLPISLTLTGSLANIPAKALSLTATVDHFPPVLLGVGWAEIDDVPLLLGQINFFAEFDVCFFRSRGYFEVKPKSATP